MTAAIKEMLAEKAMLAARREQEARLAEDVGAISPDIELLLSEVDRAAPYIDEGCPLDRWPPSAKLKITYFILATGPSPNGRSEGARLLWQMLEKARRRFLAGLHPNPFLDGAGAT